MTVEIKPFAGTYLFVKMNRNQGTNKNGNAYDIGKIVLSDGLESTEHDIKPYLVTELEAHLKRNDYVQAVIEPTTTYRGVEYVVTQLKPLQIK